MDGEIVIKATGLGKTYRIWNDPSARLKFPLARLVSELLPHSIRPQVAKSHDAYYRDFQAVHDISFEIRKGDAMGIIGRNGSGKSTLLKLIAGTIKPSTGAVSVKGRVAALLELGSGFNPDFTGRENVYLNASVLGLKREQVEARFDDIVGFSEISEFIDQPISTYSSGMVLRLAFSVAAHVDPDILIIDEALSVGDARFQLKCARAIDRFRERGVTLLFVSHDTSSVKRLCASAILLEKGRLLYGGHPNDVTNLYSKLVADGGTVEAIRGDIAELGKRHEQTSGAQAQSHPLIGSAESDARTEDSKAQEHDASVIRRHPDVEQLNLRIKALELLLSEHNGRPELTKKLEQMLRDQSPGIPVSGQEFAYGGELGRIETIAVVDGDDLPRTWFTTGERVKVNMTVASNEDLHEPIFALTIKNPAGVEIYGTNTLFSKQPSPPIRKGQRRLITFSFHINLMPGSYFLSLGFTHYFGETLAVVHRRYDTVKIDVHSRDRTFGIANLDATIQTRDLESESRVPPSCP